MLLLHLVWVTAERTPMELQVRAVGWGRQAGGEVDKIRGLHRG